MEPKPLSLNSYPRAILHIDADAFFTSVEQALTPSLQGRPVVTGKERGIIACASYEAKAFGIKRGIPLFEAKKVCPQLVILPSDYESYSLYSRKMFDIVRRYTPAVEEYSIDEVFADITGLRRVYRCSYEKIGRDIKSDIQKELGLTVSVGLSPTKALSKICSDFRKPDGFTGVPAKYIHILLNRTSLDEVWGFGSNTVSLLKKYGLNTAYDFVVKPQKWASGLLHKPGRELWNELRGNSVWDVQTEPKNSYATIVKSKTFSPASSDPDFVYAKLTKNAESAFIKSRRYKLKANRLAVILRTSNFEHYGLEAKLSRAAASYIETAPLISVLFEKLFSHNTFYRSTMIVLGGLEIDDVEQYDLFEDRPRIENMRRATEMIDRINKKYGKHKIRSAATLFLNQCEYDPRTSPHPRRKDLLKGENDRQHLNIPRPAITV